MRRVLLIVLALGLVAAAAAAVLRGVSGDAQPAYKLELDNAFGLVEGSEIRVGGVRAGDVEKVELSGRRRARVEFRLDSIAQGSLRKDVTCETRPQSLIGEYYVDCQPGRGARLAPGATIPVERTATTIPVDLVLNVLRRPYRERLGIILHELGATAAGRGADINDVIRRASPALRETDRVLAALSAQRRQLRDLTADADVLLAELAASKEDVGRFVVEGRDLASAAAARRDDIALSVHRLPPALREMTPTMQELGAAADANVPVLTDLNAAAPQLERFVLAAGELADNGLPAVRALAGAAETGRPAVRAADRPVRQLQTFAPPAAEVGNNLRFVLEDIDDRDRAVEPDPRSAGGKGFTGLESLVRLLYHQALLGNTFDEEGYMMRGAFFLDPVCGHYKTTAPEDLKHCRGWLGPNQPGITTPDPSPPASAAARGGRSSRATGQRPSPGAQRRTGAAAGDDALIDFLLGE